jgi:hypothetical protein
MGNDMPENRRIATVLSSVDDSPDLDLFNDGE